MDPELNNRVTEGRKPHGIIRWLFGFAITGFTGPFVLTVFSVVAQLLHLGPKYPKFMEISLKVLTSSWFSLFLLQGAHDQWDLVIWWLPCVAVNVGLYSLIGLVARWMRRGIVLKPKLTLVAALTGCPMLGIVSFFLGWWGRPILCEMPAGYRGLVVVQYENSTCPPLPTKGIYKVIAVNAAGRSCTSSRMLSGFRYLRFEYVDSRGTQEVLASGWYRLSTISTPQVSTNGYFEEEKRQDLFIRTR